MMEEEFLPRGHIRREKIEAEKKLEAMEDYDLQAWAQRQEDKPLEPSLDSLAKMFKDLTSPDIPEEYKEDIKHEFWAWLSKETTLTNINKEEVRENDYLLEDSRLRAMNYQRKSRYSKQFSRDLGNVYAYCYNRIRRGSGGFERDRQVMQIRTFRSEVPTTVQAKKKKGFWGKLFGG
jgi:hypothetical protein